MPERLLAWQDEADADICLVLALLYAEHTGRPVDADIVSTLDASVASWRQSVVRPLRQARRHMKDAVQAESQADALHSVVKDAELAAEKLQLAELERHVAALSMTGQSREPALAIYARYLGVEPPNWPQLAHALGRIAKPLPQ